MTDAVFSPDARDHEKCVKAGNDAAAFWMWAIQYARKRNTGGFLDETILQKIPPSPIATKKAKDLAERCVGAKLKPDGAGLFERVEGGYRIHDFAEYYQALESERERERARVRMRDVRANRQRTFDELNANAERTPNERPDSLARVPSQISNSKNTPDPDPSRDPDGNSHHARMGGRGSTIREDWMPTEKDIEFATARGWDARRIGDEVEHFRARHLSRGTVSKSWAHSWITWVLQGIRFDRMDNRSSGVQRTVRPGPSKSQQPDIDNPAPPAKVHRYP